jgi:hypothetical protein
MTNRAKLAYFSLFLFPALSLATTDISPHLPLVMEDAVSAIGTQGELGLRAARSNESSAGYELRPLLRQGLGPCVHLELGIPFHFGHTDRARSGDLTPGIFLAALPERLATRASVSVPTGRNSRGLHAEMKLLGSFPLGTILRLHGNLIWHRYEQSGPAERETRHGLVVGTDLRLSRRLWLLSDFVREQHRRRGEVRRIAELGLLWQTGSRTLLAAGAGAPLGRSAERYSLSLGLRYSLQREAPLTSQEPAAH